MWPFKRNKHKHNWELTGVRWMEYVILGGSVTLALYRCTDCDQITTGRIEGHWSFEQLKEKSNAKR
jgi:hypothetical protein